MANTNTDTLSSLAQNAAQKLGWSPVFVQKQWALETGNFKSDAWKIDNNPAGIKWYPGMTFGTKGIAASDGGNYAHFSDPVTGYVEFVKHNSRYSNVASSQDPNVEAQTIAKDGWATDPNYASKVIGMTVNGNQTVNTSPGSSDASIPGLQQTSFGLPNLPNLLSNALGVIVGAGIVFLGIWVAMNPLSDLTTVIMSAAKQFSKMPLEGATNAVKNAPNAARKRMGERKENNAIKKQEKALDKHITHLEKKRNGKVV